MLSIEPKNVVSGLVIIIVVVVVVDAITAVVSIGRMVVVVLPSLPSSGPSRNALLFDVLLLAFSNKGKEGSGSLLLLPFVNNGADPTNEDDGDKDAEEER